MANTITIYDIKRTLTSGKGKICARKALAMRTQGWYSWKGDWLIPCRKQGRDCALTREDALKLAEELRQRKIRNLQWQIERLQALEFTIVEEGNG